MSESCGKQLSGKAGISLSNIDKRRWRGTRDTSPGTLADLASVQADGMQTRSKNRRECSREIEQEGERQSERGRGRERGRETERGREKERDRQTKTPNKKKCMFACLRYVW